jgi:hypothetical protein
MIMKGESMRSAILLLLAVCVAAGVSGCSGMETIAFRSDGIPCDKYQVGGGWDIEYKAPAPGTVYLVEMNNRRLIETKSLDEGETYRQNIDPGESRLKDMGIEPSAARFWLYFIPAPKEKPCSRETGEKAVK